MQNLTEYGQEHRQHTISHVQQAIKAAQSQWDGTSCSTYGYVDSHLLGSRGSGWGLGLHLNFIMISLDDESSLVLHLFNFCSQSKVAVL